MVMRGGTQQSPFAPATPAQEPPPQPPSPPPRRKHGGGHPRTSPQATQAILKALDAGESISAAARAGGVRPQTARRIWDRERGGEPPGKGAGAGSRQPAMTGAQVRKARRLRGQRGPNGRWEHSIRGIAEQLGVSRSAVYRALRRDKSSEEERS